MLVNQFTIQTSERQQLVDITSRVSSIVRDWDVPSVLVYVPHTTAGILINEHADPDVAADMLTALDAIVPVDAGYRHAEGNSPAHVKTSLVGTSQVVPLEGGRLRLGTWQGIFLAEFDGPRMRKVYVSAL
jgi:secondary thiamine-phosphate synthase enzyme